MAQVVKNITSIDYFTSKFDVIDIPYNISMKYHPYAITSRWTTLPTFIAEFNNCSVTSLPLLITEDRHMITEHIWPVLDKYKHKPQKHHKLWDYWNETMEIEMPPIKEQFNGVYKYVWLPIDQESVNNPWHIWIDVISKFRLMEKRWSTDFSKYVYVLSNKSEYFEKVHKELFPEMRFITMPKDETWRFQHLLVPSMSNHNDGVVMPHLPPWLRHFKGSFGAKKCKPHRKIFVSRSKAHTRKVKNQTELLMALKGWETVVLEDLSIREQVKMFAEATHVLSTHGAGLVNSLWCQEGTKITEIQDKNMLHKKVYPLLSNALNLKHETYLANTTPIKIKGKKPKNVKRLNDLIDFDINIPDLIRHLD
jgi:hypothetical protein